MASPTKRCRSGETGRRRGLKIPRSLAPCRFDSDLRHHRPRGGRRRRRHRRLPSVRCPKEIFAPRSRRLLTQEAGVKTEQPARSKRRLDEPEAGLGRRPAALLAIAGLTAGDNVRPCCRSPSRARNNMVARGLVGLELFPAVLAAELVARVNVLPREFDVPRAEPDEAEKTNDRRHAKAAISRPHFTLGLLDNLNLLEKNEFDRSSPVDHVERLERCVQQKDLFEGDSPLFVANPR